MKIKEIVHYVKKFIFPNRCVVCDEVLAFGDKLKNEYLCDACRDKFEFIKEPTCKKCGAMMNNVDEAYCEICKANLTDLYEYGFGLFRYNDYLKESLHRVKYNGRKEYLYFYGKCLAKAFNEKIKAINPDCFIPVPIHKKRLIERGYNQAEVLADVISDELKKYNINIPVKDNIIFRNKNTVALNKLSSEERKGQLTGAFTANKVKNINRVIIVDDIRTLGGTVKEMAKVLKTAGIEKVYYMVITIVDNI